MSITSPIRLTLRRLEAIQEALFHRLAGEIEDDEDAPQHADYEAALQWVSDQIAKRSSPADDEAG